MPEETPTQQSGTTASPTTSTPAPAPQPNEPAARAPDGTLKDQSPTSTEPVAAPAEPPKAPTEYAAFTMPEGAAIDAVALKDAAAVFKELGLSQDQAQRLVNFQVAREMATGKLVDDMRADWRQRVVKDPVLGPKLDEVKAAIGRAKMLLDPEVRNKMDAAFNLTGAGDHPDIIRGWFEMALKVNEGKHVSGAGPTEPSQRAPGTPARPSAAAAMYPTLPSSMTRQ